MLGDDQVELARRAARVSSFADTKTAIEALNSDQQNALAGLLEEWEPLDKKRHLRLSGGRDGVDLNFERRTVRLESDIRKMLGISDTSDRPVMFALARGCRGA